MLKIIVLCHLHGKSYSLALLCFNKTKFPCGEREISFPGCEGNYLACRVSSLWRTGTGAISQFLLPNIRVGPKIARTSRLVFPHLVKIENQKVEAVNSHCFRNSLVSTDTSFVRVIELSLYVNKKID